MRSNSRNNTRNKARNNKGFQLTGIIIGYNGVLATVLFVATIAGAVSELPFDLNKTVADSKVATTGSKDNGFQELLRHIAEF